MKVFGAKDKPVRYPSIGEVEGSGRFTYVPPPENEHVCQKPDASTLPFETRWTCECGKEWEVWGAWNLDGAHWKDWRRVER